MITNIVTAQSFSSKYPKSELPGYAPDFMESFVDGYAFFDDYHYGFNYFKGEGLSNLKANEGALAYFWIHLIRYRLIKMNSDGTFTKIDSIKTGGEESESTFSKTKCQN